MRNKENWAPSKYILVKGRWRASRDPDQVNPGSRLMVDLIAGFYNEYLKQYTGGKLLDLGCGKVPLYGAYREFITESTCVDWQDSIHGSEFIDVWTDLNQPLPFPDHEFNTIILSDVLEHICQPDLLWSEMARILKPGGILFLNVPFFYHLHEQPNDYFRFTRFALEKFARTNGFEVVVLAPLGGLPEILTDIHAKILARIPMAGTCLAACLQHTAIHLLRLRPLHKLSIKTAQTFPLGYFFIARKK